MGLRSAKGGMRIAIQGSGVAAASCAQRLSQNHHVTVFESGRGPGGRMSTRRAAGYQWDHGAQHFSPKTPGFAAAVDQWVGSGLCAAWPGDHCEWADGAVSPAPASGGAPTTRYVGAPGMNAICKGLLEGVETHYETRAVAKRRRDGGAGWTLQHGKSGADLGDYDLLICSDKTAAARHRPDFDTKLLSGFARPASAVRSAPSLALMVATEATGVAFDSLLLREHPIFSWIARDSSKPGRARDDGAECWVAHTSASFATRLTSELRKQKRSSPNAIRGAIVRSLVPSLQELLCELGGDRPEVLFAQGHRWGAAFPASSFDSGGSSATDQFYLDRTNAFAACGDFFTPFPGRVEGGWISGTSLADAIR